MNDMQRNKTGMTVTQRASSIKQPRGGYVKRREFDETSLGIGEDELNENENIHGSLIGISVDYLTRYMLTHDLRGSFAISLLGASNVKDTVTAERLLKSIKGLDDTSILNALKLAGFDAAYRSGASSYVPVSMINPDAASIKNIRIMVERTMSFFEEYGPVTSYGFSFPGAYTKTIINGDGDYLTENTLWDLKALKNNFAKKHTMQLLIYWRMGLRSDCVRFKKIKYLGIFNPRKNIAYRYNLEDLDSETIDIIDEDIIGYDKSFII
ncbi:hypothetical protein [uncultured Anaerococcus sp.]|uniref:hypothetical protein n=1 Tax=uncultured Anaerococcus sp. TaxID=293428 RepID=UPI00262DBD18|nr:hypothetical protein [uncultured Anaerococcus sp.]